MKMLFGVYMAIVSLRLDLCFLFSIFDLFSRKNIEKSKIHFLETK